MSKTECDVIIIDSGITKECYCDYKKRIIGYKSFGDDEYIYDKNGHGTAVFHKIAYRSNASIFLIKIFDDRLEVCEDRLVSALLFIIHNLKGKILNLSLGLTQCNSKSYIEDLCKKIVEEGTLIIAAYDNTGALSYPAAFPFVLGVDVSNECRKEDDFIVINNSIVDVLGFGKMQRVKWLENVPFAFVSGSSFAAANITHFLIVYIETNNLYNINYDESKKVLSKHAIKNLCYTKTSRQDPPIIKKAIALPYNKEISSLINYDDLLTFELIDIYDFHVTGNVSRIVNSIFKNNSYTIKDVEDICWEDDFDTIIVGHVHELELALNFNIIDFFIAKCSLYNKKLFLFDWDETDSTLNNSNVYCSPKIDRKNVGFTNGKLFLNNTPVLGVWGTSSYQGKFTLQLYLRRAFIKNGYRISQISTEPSGYLFGMDSVIPMGYNSSVNMNFRETICYINQEISRIGDNEPDLIIVGAQSNSTLYYPGNISQFPTAQIELLLGSMPDAVILCVNSFDDHFYIKRTINMIESLTYSKVIALGLYPLKNKGSGMLQKKNTLSNIEIDNKKTVLKSDFQLPVFTIGVEKEMESVFLYIIDWFSNEHTV